MGSIFWILQRVTALIMLTFVLLFVSFFSQHPLTYQNWTHFFYCPLYSMIFRLMWIGLLLHAWIGLWTVVTDYVRSHQFRFIILISYSILLFLSGLSALLY